MIELLKKALEAVEPQQKDHRSTFKLEVAYDLRQAIAELEKKEPVALQSFIKWDEDIEPVGEVVGFIEDSNYIMVKVHDEKQISLNDELYIRPPQCTEQEPLANELAQLKEEIALLKYKLWDCEEKSKPMQGQ